MLAQIFVCHDNVSCRVDLARYFSCPELIAVYSILVYFIKGEE